MSPIRSRGFSLIELMVASSLFMGLMVVIFLFFRYATRAYVTATQRQGVQADALRVMDGLQADLRRTSANSIRMLNDATRTRLIEGVTVHRDVLSFVGLQDWSDPTNTQNFDVTNAQPIWNRYWVFYATKDQDRGILVRLKVDPTPPPVAPKRLTSSELTDLCRDDPNLNRFHGISVGYVALARNVYDFQVQSFGRNQLQISLKLQEKRRLRPDGSKIEGQETYQLLMNVRPENTVPQDL